MNERDIFLAALDKATAEQRSEYLSVACAGDATVRQRVEELLRVHSQTGDFLQVPLVERLADGVAAQEEAAGATGDREPSDKRTSDLGFLSPSEQPGSLGRLGHYEVQEVIGRGGMGIVLRAFDERLHRVVAIKVMAAQLATNAASRKRFQREARAAAAVCHDHIVTIHAVEEAGDLPYLVMQCVSGMSLQQRIDRDGPLALHEILRIGMQTAAGLAAAHAQGLIHRDIKPANILLENGVERVKITDFGLARAAADASVSQTGIVAGTPQYMSPEQARGEAIDCRTDLFSLGSVLYAMCTGRAPFRATSSLAVLKRVCEDTPRLIREANADIPDWLIALIDKLLAKDPQDRYQSAAEVAELLARRLAELQHSAILPVVATMKVPKSAIRKRGTRDSGSSANAIRRWAVTAAVLLALVVTFGMSEATGVTQVAATVVRLITREGTLVIETDDPAVKVTVEGDGDLVITGAGPQEVRLRAGSYRLHAVKDGQPVMLDRDLVTITQGQKQVVRVRLESTSAAPAAAAPGSDFVLLGGEGVAERKFDTLAAAVIPASNGDTIEVRGNGPYVTGPVDLGHRALTLRAAPGFYPVVRLDRDASVAGAAVLSTRSNLVLEGLEFGETGKFDGPGFATRLVADGSSVSAANCRFHWPSGGILKTSSRTGRFRNCQFVTGAGMAWHHPDDGSLTIDNCVQANGGLLWIPRWPVRKTASPVIRVANCTVRARTLLSSVIDYAVASADVAPEKVVGMSVTESVLDVDELLMLSSKSEKYAELGQLAEKLNTDLPHFLAWKDRQNLYAADNFDTTVALYGSQRIRLQSVGTLPEWDKLWGQENSGSSLGRVRYHGGDPLAGQMTPDDFRLRPDSAGDRAGRDSKDLGADVDLVGPGAAYEQWKKSPEYQEWLKETGQIRGP